MATCAIERLARAGGGQTALRATHGEDARVANTGKLKVRVDREVPGHNRCKALAPGCSRLDGTHAREKGDGTVPPGLGGRPTRKSDLSRFAVEVPRLAGTSVSSAVKKDWHRPLIIMDRSPSRSGTRAQEMPIAHTDRSWASICRRAMPTCVRVAYDNEHFSSRRVVVRETPPPRVRPTHPSDPPGTARAHGAAAPFTPTPWKKIEPAGAGDRQTADRQFIARAAATRRWSIRRRSPCGVMPHMLVARGRCYRYRKWDHPDPEVGDHRPERADAGLGEMSTIHGHVHEPLREPRTTDQLSASAKFNGQGGRGIAVGACGCCLLPASHDLERHRLVPLALAKRPPIAAGSSRSPRMRPAFEGVPARLRARWRMRRRGKEHEAAEVNRLTSVSHCQPPSRRSALSRSA